jgi:RHS repeat-associated protein
LKRARKYIASLGVPPGPPDKKGIYASPQYTGKPWPDFGSPLNSSLSTPPEGWPKMPVFNPPGGPPGPPVQFGPAQTNDSVNGGYGYSGTGTFAEDRYFYHHDHLGSSSYLTNQLGNITQHVEYIPFGEVFVEERNEKWNTPYLFNGKELDEETGLYYYGARYYDSKISLWLSVDPLAEQFPSWSPYSYGFNNPLRFTDPTGMAPEDFIKNKTTGEIEWRADVTSKATTPEGYDYVGSTYNGLSISKYDAHTTRGIGIEIQAGYNDGKEGDLDVRWVQTIRTNNPLGGATSPYNDPQPPDDAKPFYWTDAELPDYKNKGGQDLIFYDRPTRSASKDGVTWEGELSAVINSGDGYKPVVTIRYGFETKGGVAVPSKVIVNTPSDFQNKTIEDYNKTLSKP